MSNRRRGEVILAALLAGLMISSAHAADRVSHGMGYEAEPEMIYKSFSAVPRYRAFLPPEIDLSPRFPTPGDQGQQGSCVAWATGYALRSFYEAKAQNREQITSDDQVFSPAYIYNRLHANGNCSGTAISRALDLLKTEGAPPLAAFPYTPDDCARQPGSDIKSLAAPHKIKSWRALNAKRLDDIKGQLAAGNPVVFGMDVSKSFDELRGDSIYDDTDSPRIGSHAMVLVGYSEPRQAFKLINSWGTNWGDGGFGWVSYRALLALSDRQFVMDASLEPPPKPPAPSPSPAPVVVNPPRPAPVVAPPKPAIPTLGDTRTAVAARVKQAPCARIETTLSADRGIRLAGFIGATADLDKLRADLAAMPGVARVIGDVQLRPWPQCEVFLDFDQALAVRKGLDVALKGTATNAFRAGDSLVIEVTTPSYPSYLYVSYLQASGEIAHLSWPAGRFPKAVPPNTKITFGGTANGQPVYRVGPPFGDEVVVVVASASPLFQEALPETANDRDYLTSFRRAFIMRPQGGGGERIVSAAVATLRTEAK